MPIYKVSYWTSGETVYIVKANSEEDIGMVLEQGRFEVNDKTIFAERDTTNGRVEGLDNIVKIGE